MSVYEERAVLLALLSCHYPAHLAEQHDGEEGFRWLVCIHFPTGQGAWHLSDNDLRYFGHLEPDRNHWDGHTTEQKYERILALVGDIGEEPA